MATEQTKTVELSQEYIMYSKVIHNLVDAICSVKDYEGNLADCKELQDCKELLYEALYRVSDMATCSAPAELHKDY